MHTCHSHDNTVISKVYLRITLHRFVNPSQKSLCVLVKRELLLVEYHVVSAEDTFLYYRC